MANRDYRERSAVLASDIQARLEQHPDSFDCLIYRSIRSTAEDVVAGLVADVVGSSEGSERKIDYADPVEARALIVPDEGFLFSAYTEGSDEENINSSQGPLVLLLSESNIPKQSIVTWNEFIGQADTDTKEVRVYVLESKSFGKAPSAGLKHYCVPMLDEGEID